MAAITNRSFGCYKAADISAYKDVLKNKWYYNDVGSGSGLMANQDWFKSHPFYGGLKIRANGTGNWNRGIEAVLQSAKFRRLYLRRLRTLMDQELKEPGTAKEEIPLMAKMRNTGIISWILILML